MSQDIHLGTCVICDTQTSSKQHPDFCEECIEFEKHTWNFGRCYFCSDYSEHQSCIGPPCQCPCEGPDENKAATEREAILAKLTPYERQVLGF